ncbi:MAG: hypothetical protein K0S28_908 [Paucimonas sp.]|nr:hypothetical protein [Paucimonas sp.]
MKHLTLKLLFPAMLVFCAGTAQAQYVWLNEKGVKQFSDMPPPADVPKNRILKEPGLTRQMPTNEETSTGEPESAEKPEDKRPLTTAEKNAEYKKRRAEQAEKEKKAQDEANLKKQKAENCERARAYARNLESGIRIRTTDANGEPSFMSDEKREHELREAGKVASKECN